MSVPYDGQSNDPNIPAISGKNAPAGFVVSGIGVYGESTSGVGVEGHSYSGVGVRGVSDSSSGVNGQSTSSYGVSGQSDSFAGVFGYSNSSYGVYGECQNGEGIRGVSHSQHGGVVGVNTAGGPAGFFEGNVTVTGDVFLTGADCAEEFEISEAADFEPGTVMVINQEGALQPNQQAYDKRVAGVVSGAGKYRSGITLDKQPSQNNRRPIALVGKVYCKVDARYSPIEVGDLLTTSPTPGHAMKAEDPFKAFGAVIGKALRSLEAGQGMIPILIALQ